MMSLLANFFVDLGSGLAQGSSSACVFMFLDEPKCPKSLLK